MIFHRPDVQHGGIFIICGQVHRYASILRKLFYLGSGFIVPWQAIEYQFSFTRFMASQFTFSSFETLRAVSIRIFLFLWNLFLPDTYNDSGYCQTGENPSFMDVNTTMNETPTCPAVGYQSASICVPVTVTPFAQTGVTTTKCCGSPVVTSGREVCNGVRNGSCVFTISQDICVAGPVEFGAVASVGDSYISCNGASDQDICTGCGEVVPTVPETVVPQV